MTILARKGNFGSGSAGLDLLEGLLYVREDELVRADLAHELDDVELIARDGRVRELAEAANLGDDVAQLVEVLNGLAHGGVGDVDAEALFQLVDDLELELGLVVVEGGLVALHRRVDDGDEELVVLDGVYEEEMLLHPLHGGAALGAEEGAEVVVAALDAALEDGADVGTVAVRHVVSGDVRGGTTRARAGARKSTREDSAGLRGYNSSYTPARSCHR